jgi:hypothetical protein
LKGKSKKPAGKVGKVAKCKTVNLYTSNDSKAKDMDTGMSLEADNLEFNNVMWLKEALMMHPGHSKSWCHTFLTSMASIRSSSMGNTLAGCMFW